MTPRTTPTRGQRNNNPLNIRIGNVWLGEVRNPTDPDFEQFVSILYGLRAAFVLLRRYIRHYHRDTVRTIISAWAPSSENNTASYISSVCTLAHLDPDTPIDFADKPTLLALVSAMAVVESCMHLEERTLSEAYDMA